jgi:hypothetical protein
LGPADVTLELVVISLGLVEEEALLAPLAIMGQLIVLAVTAALTAAAAVAEVSFTTTARVLTALFLAEAMEDLARFASFGPVTLAASHQRTPVICKSRRKP